MWMLLAFDGPREYLSLAQQTNIIRLHTMATNQLKGVHERERDREKEIPEFHQNKGVLCE